VFAFGARPELFTRPKTSHPTPQGGVFRAQNANALYLTVRDTTRFLKCILFVRQCAAVFCIAKIAIETIPYRSGATATETDTDWTSVFYA